MEMHRGTVDRCLLHDRSFEFANVLALFDLPEGTEIVKALRLINESHRAEGFDNKIMNGEIKVANTDTWRSFDGGALLTKRQTFRLGLNLRERERKPK